MPQPRYNHSGDRDFDVGPRLIEDEEIEALSLRDIHAGAHLIARVVERAEPRVKAWFHRRRAARGQEGVVLQTQRSGAVEG